MKRHSKFGKILKPIIVRYWGFDPDFGTLYGEVRSKLAPHLCVRWYKPNMGYVGWDPDRHRFVVRPGNEYSIIKRRLAIGWRKEVYGPRTPRRIWKKHR
jgi:hypothetical protein